jgi:hypothetical protein
MKIWPRRPLMIPSLVLLAALAGCSSLARDTRLVPGQSSEAEVTAIYGAPARVWPDPDGGRTLEYSSQPRGRTCYMVKLDANGRLLSIEDTLLPPGRARVKPGMTPEQVSRLLGRERTRVFFKLSGEDVWDWNVTPDQAGARLRFNVHFKNGVVLRSTESMVDADKFFLFDD